MSLPAPRAVAGRRPDLIAAVAAAATLLAAWLGVVYGPRISLTAVLGVFAVGLIFVAFVSKPHLGVAGLVVLFALVPALKVFVSPLLGATKDVATAAAVCGAVIVGLFDRPKVDRRIVVLVGMLLALYVINAGGGHGLAWLQGVRLVSEPLLLLLVGLVLPDPRRNLRYAVGALIIAACFEAAYGVLQQLVGAATLVSWGYEYGTQVRTVGAFMRSFGTSDDPFTYAAFLLFGLAAVLFTRRRGGWTTAAFVVITLGLFASLVRTAVLIVAAFVGLMIGRRGDTVTAALLVAATTLAGLALLITQATGTETRTFQVSTPTGTERTTRPGVADLVLNGRVSAWSAALGDQPHEWFFGRGVGEVGTAADRAGVGFAPVEASGRVKAGLAVDSGYLAAIADVGILGLGVLLALLGRLVALALAAARRGLPAGWLALAVILALLIDATTRASFTGFPTAFVAMLLIGLALAAAREELSSARAAGTPA